MLLMAAPTTTEVVLVGLDPDAWVSVSEVCDELRVNENTFRAMLRRGTGPRHYRIGRGIRLRVSDVRCWVAGRAA